VRRRQGIELHSSFLEYQDIHKRHVIELLRKVKPLGLDLFHDVVTVQADVTANYIWAGGRVWAIAIVVYDKKPPAGLEGPPHALHCCLRVVEVMIRVEENCPIEPVCGQLRIALRAEYWMHVPPTLGGNAFPNLIKEFRIDIDGEDRTAAADLSDEIGQKMANTGPRSAIVSPACKPRESTSAPDRWRDPRIGGSISEAAFARRAGVRYSSLAAAATCATAVHAVKKTYPTTPVMPNQYRRERSIRNSCFYR